ncbi:hypothetical protein RRG08_038005 [Elysia crispata]|uniref:Uncharacterized protein n=1 Tax=Elysia crispata TaxID=231223 RepID=A0AAE1DXD7_9GAST|nr:hypothetical protein RRG08_038005 [Elysia crispata]
MLIPKLLWPLLVYKIFSTTVEATEAKINKFTRRWLGVSPDLTEVAMYCRKPKLRLPLKSILEEYKCGKARLLSMLEDSEDPVVKTVQPTIKTEKRDLVINDIRLNEDSRRVQKAVQQPQQGQWTNWDNALQKSLTWNKIWHMAPHQINFFIRSVYDLLPSNANLKEEAHICRREKYLNPTKELEDAGYRAVVMPIEVGARGFIGSSI